MSNQTALTVAFLDRAPRSAALELQRLPVGDAAALIESVPARLCAPVLHSMIPWHAARLLESITADKAAGILRQLGFADSVTLTRLVAAAHREKLFEALPSRYGRRLRSALEYPQHQVGAWVDPEVPTLQVNHTAADALRVFRAADTASHVFLEAAEHEKFVGLVSVREILRAEPTVSLGRLPRANPTPISNRATLASLAFDERWDEFLFLPVVARRGNLLGGLSRRTLRQALHEQHVAATDTHGSILRAMGVALSVTVAGIFTLVSARTAQAPESIVGGAVNEP
jgi:Mg/Co/Ni transporter MgtE